MNMLTRVTQVESVSDGMKYTPFLYFLKLFENYRTHFNQICFIHFPEKNEKYGLDYFSLSLIA